MPLALTSFISGLLFGLGLIISQMVNPAKVLAFLDLFGTWDPSLAFVLASAVAVSALGYRIARRRGAPVLGARLEVPNRRDLDGRLVLGAALFGIGWGLVGLCPGPALTALPLGAWQVLVFVAAMLGGMLLFKFVPKDWPHSVDRRAAGS